MTPLFDSNAHPTLDGTAFGKGARFETLSAQLAEAGFIGACAVGLPGCGGYEAEAFMRECRRHRGLEPVAAWIDVPSQHIEDRVNAIKDLGYRAIKLHPRMSGLSVRDPRFLRVLQSAAAAEVAIFHCTYQFGAEADAHPTDPLPFLMEAISNAPNIRVVLLHGGTVEVLRYAEAIRAYPNVLLDLSFTLNRYLGSSIDSDIAYLFKNFDQRICVGSDFPQYEPGDVRQRFNSFASSLAEDKIDNIAWKNITSLLKIPSAVGR